MFISFEGIDGCGKSTQSSLLAEWLVDKGEIVLQIREPGGTALGEQVREILLGGPTMTAKTEAALFAAARSELTETIIKPALEDGQWVIADRFVDSSLAYQGVGRQLGINQVLVLNTILSGPSLLPDLTFLLDLEVDQARKRLYGSKPDRLESLDKAFHLRVRKGYLAVAKSFPNRIVLIDASASKATVAAKVLYHTRLSTLRSRGRQLWTTQ